MKPHQIRHGALIVATALMTSAVAALALASTNHAPDEDRAPPALQACGTPGAPPCPLQAWMRAYVGAPLAANKMTTLADGLDRAAALSPDPAWGSWATIAVNGAQAARKGDIAGARASCKACHDAWRSAYKAKYRMRPIPR